MTKFYEKDGIISNAPREEIIQGVDFDSLWGRAVLLEEDGSTLPAFVSGIDEDGNLTIEDADGERYICTSAPGTATFEDSNMPLNNQVYVFNEVVKGILTGRINMNKLDELPVPLTFEDKVAHMLGRPMSNCAFTGM